MIDIHCHILPGLDDGAKDIEESLAMASIAQKDGIKTIVATPHSLNGIFNNERKNILREIKKLQKILEQENIDIKLIPGADVHINYNILELIEQGEALTINDQGRYILLELPHHFVPPKIDEQIFELKLRGITPIFTHPERNFAIQDDLRILLRFIELGALTQITSLSITGLFGHDPYKSAIEILKGNMAHIIASDAHSPNIRSPGLSRAVDKVAQIVGLEFANDMVTTIPQAIITGKSLPDIPEPMINKKSFFQRIFK